MAVRQAVFCGKLRIGAALLLVAGSASAQGPKPAARTAVAAKPTTVPRTLSEALAATYMNQPALQAERAKLRATDENVPQALAGWKPTVIVAGTAGYGDGLNRQFLSSIGGWEKLKTDRDIATAQATVTQPLYTGGKTRANVNRATDLVMAERANLMAQEETSFANAVNAYVGVIQAQQLLALSINNEQVLRQQLQATNDQFRVGEVTRTDVAQAEAALATAVAQQETAQGNLQTSRGTYVQVIGYEAPPDLVEPQPLKLPVRSQQDASALAAANNPAVIAAQFNNAAAKNAVEAAFASLLPQVSLQAQVFQSNNSAARSSAANGYQAVVQVSVPLYQGGAEYSAVRQARQTQQQQSQLVGDAQRTAVQNAVNAWDTLAAARAAADSTRTAIRANQIALVGVEREHLVGTRTTLDVLNAQQTLLQSQVNLVQNLANLVTASYAVASAVGRLTARDLNLPVPLYDETAYYNRVKNKWVGIGVPDDETLYVPPLSPRPTRSSP
ncbi:MAG TPA: TolC family outer membrane protein [Acetobacteraceae bacterium]|nr:TolC family outer membrane protein [Acetobacteraceae bacterium]